MNTHKIDAFVKRLEKIGIKVELAGNFPWVYLYAVNGKKVTEKFGSYHGFTAFYANKSVVWSDRRAVFNKIRNML